MDIVSQTSTKLYSPLDFSLHYLPRLRGNVVIEPSLRFIQPKNSEVLLQSRGIAVSIVDFLALTLFSPPVTVYDYWDIFISRLDEMGSYFNSGLGYFLFRV